MPKPIIPYLGGKGKIAYDLISKFPAHNCYAEVFGGGAAVLFQKPKQISTLEVLNDLDGELINFYRVVVNNMDEFIGMFRWMLISRELFYEEKAKDPATLTKMERAFRYFYLQKLCFGATGKCVSKTFGVQMDRTRLRLEDKKLQELIERGHNRLKTVVIENLDWQELVRRYDSNESLFFCDPPYPGIATKKYKHNQTLELYINLNKAAKEINGKMLITVSDNKEMRETFKDHYITTIDTEYTISKDKSKRQSELIISNFEIIDSKSQKLLF